MLVGLLLSGNLTGFGTAGATPTPTVSQPAGKRTWKQANASWNARNRWAKQAASWLAEHDEPQARKHRAVKPGKQSTQVALDALQGPRTAPPAPLSLQWLVERSTGLPAGLVLMQEMVSGTVASIARAAYEAEQALVRQNDDALAILLVMISL